MTTQTTRPSAWLGMVIFSGVIVMLLGSFQLIEGVVAIVRDEHYFTTSSGLAVDFNYTVWGVLHSILGVLVLAISGLGNLLFLPAQPFWCTLVIALDVLVIYTLAVHGREAR
jgi:uncharacterized membrane protein HdeD (DUF308 family)